MFKSVWLGADTRLTERWTGGLAVSRAYGETDWRGSTVAGRLSTRMTAAHPYARWSDGVWSISAMAGAGRGQAESSFVQGPAPLAADLTLYMGVAEFRRRLADSIAGIRVGAVADVARAQLGTSAGDTVIDGQTAAVTQARLGAEASAVFRVLAGADVSPFVKAYARREGGPDMADIGFEGVAGVRVVCGPVRVDALGRVFLASSSAVRYRDRGAALAVSFGDRSMDGAFLRVSPSWGRAPGGRGSPGSRIRRGGRLFCGSALLDGRRAPRLPGRLPAG